MMFTLTWLYSALLLSSYVCALNELKQREVPVPANNSSSHVPLLISNNSLSSAVASDTANATLANGRMSNEVSPFATNIAQNVPSRRNSSEHAATYLQSQSSQLPASVFFSNYNNQQNVMQLVRNINGRLHNIRNVEMRFATIQEVFDSMHFTGATVSNVVSQNNSDVKQNVDGTSALLYQDLQIFSRRLEKKLQKAIHVVLELRDFFRTNITKLSMHDHTQQTDYNDDDDDEDVDTDTDFDLEIDDLDLDSISMTTSKHAPHYKNLYLSTFIHSFQSRQPGSEQNYNKHQIQILNYLKTDRHVNQHFDTNFLSEHSARSLEANVYISEKIEQLKTKLTKTTEDNLKFPLNIENTSSNVRSKFVGNHYKHIYFLSRSDDASDHNEGNFYDMHFRHLYVAAIQQKFVVLLIDVGSAMNGELLELTKSFVHNVLQMLTDTDLISVITVADEARSMLLESYTRDATNGIYFATRDCKDDIISYVNNLSAAKTPTNHSLGFEYAFQTLQMLQNASLITAENPIEFIYITRGLLTNLSEATHVLNVIASGQKRVVEPIVINTCAVVLDEKRMMYEKQFLNDIAMQNFSKYDINITDWYSAPPRQLEGKLFVLSKRQPDMLIRASTAVFKHLFNERYLTQTLTVHPPVVDAISKETIVSITHTATPFGVVGVNLYLSDLIEDVVNYRQQERNKKRNEFVYAFIIDRNGMTIAHPAFPRTLIQNETPFPVDIGFLENSTDFTSIRRKMLQDRYVNATTMVYVTQNRKTELMNRTYQWQTILGVYTLCVVSTSRKNSHNNSNVSFDSVITSANVQIPTSMPITLQHYGGKENMPAYQESSYEYTPAADLLYHRLDLFAPANAKVCRYFHQYATMDAITLFLSSSAFESPFTFLHNNRLSSKTTQIRTVESIMAYIKDTTGLIANPGLRPVIRQEANMVYNAMHHLKKRHQDNRSTLKNYIIRRYIASINGVLQVYPGCLLSSNYDPTRRPWFRKAIQQPGKIITTEPYLDAGGAGYIVTVAHTIFEGKANALHSPERDQPVAIVALDLPYAYYYKMILETTQLCQLPNIKCLLFENEGYLIAHPSMMETTTLLKNQRRPHEHLTHKESYLANDILNHKILVRKLACANYQNRTLQRYYVFNTSLNEILTNVVHGERTKYAISLVRGSNIFAAVLNSTCDGGAFCPCSTINRICLNCKRMDQSDCECPCECPMSSDAFVESDYSGSYDYFRNYTQQYSYCEPPSEHFIALPSTSGDNFLEACMKVNCDVYGTQNECLAVMGCEWCQQDLDGNAFSAAFCAAQSSCFNGVLSSLTPYGDLDDVDIITAHGYNPGQKPNSYSAFGPVGGAIVVLAIVIGFAIYCYRQNIDTHAQDQFYIDSMQEENYGLPLSRFNFDDCQAVDEAPGNAYDHLSAQRNLMHPADISPYHVSTGSSYRRPPNGESDHGYSTMTPHEDSSDHQCFTLAEPLLLNDKRNSKSDTMSVSTSISSPTNRQQQNYHNSCLAQSTTPAVTIKEARYNFTSPKKFHTHSSTSPARVYEQTTLPLNDSHEEQLNSHYILAPVTVHRHMETSES